MGSDQGAPCVVQLHSEILKDGDDSFSEQLAGCARGGTVSHYQPGPLLCCIMLLSHPPAMHVCHLVQVANINHQDSGIKLLSDKFAVSLSFPLKIHISLW